MRSIALSKFDSIIYSSIYLFIDNPTYLPTYLCWIISRSSRCQVGLGPATVHCLHRPHLLEQSVSMWDEWWWVISDGCRQTDIIWVSWWPSSSTAVYTLSHHIIKSHHHITSHPSYHIIHHITSYHITSYINMNHLSSWIRTAVCPSWVVRLPSPCPEDPQPHGPKTQGRV
jgi:hypothetical protein